MALRSTDRTGTYYDDLEKALRFQKLFCEKMAEECGDDVNDDFKEAIALYGAFGPFISGVTYVYNNRFVWELKDAIFRGEIDAYPSLTNSEIFNVLKKLSKYTVIDFLSMVQTSTVRRKKLVDSVLSDNFDTFDSIIEKNELDTSYLSMLCSSCWEDARIVLDFESERDIVYYLDKCERALLNADDEGALVSCSAMRQMEASFNQLGECCDDEAEAQYSSAYLAFVKSIIPQMFSYYWDNYESYTVSEQIIINREIPADSEWVSVMRATYDTKCCDAEEEPGQLPPPAEELPKPKEIVRDVPQIVTKEASEEKFVVPDDFFGWGNRCSNTLDSEHFIGVNVNYLQSEAVQIYQELIDWLASAKYIDDIAAVKWLLLYRLTGYGRPSQFLAGQELPAIEWHAVNSYELIFLIRFFPNNSDYKKMKRFFTGPKWVKEKDSSYADLASPVFKEVVGQYLDRLKAVKKRVW